MLFRRLQRHQIDYVDKANLQIGQGSPQQVHGRQRLEGGNIAGARHHHVGLAVFVVARPFPDADAGGAMLDGGIHVEVLQRRLFSCDDDIDKIVAAQAMVGDRKQRVGIGRQINTDNIGLLVTGMIDEARVLVRKPLWSWRQTWDESR